VPEARLKPRRAAEAKWRNDRRLPAETYSGTRPHAGKSQESTDKKDVGFAK
jgi:hypothetical protein